MASPLAVIGGHKKAVSYVRFLGGNRLVSASTDNTLKLWDIDRATSSQGPCDSLMTYSGIILPYYPVHKVCKVKTRKMGRYVRVN